MAQPTVQGVHVDAILTAISVAYIQNSKNFIASQVFPVVPVDKQSDLFFKYTKNDWFRDEAKVRADGTESAGSGYGLSTDSYRADVFAIHKDIGTQIRANADAPIDLDSEATRFVTQRLMLRQEIQWVTDYFASGIWGTDKTVTNTWDNQTASDPVDDVELAKETILQNTGFEANTLVLGYQVWRKLKQHPDLIDRFKYTSSESITTDMLARVFGVDKILIAKGVKATNHEGATAAMAFTHGKNALLCYSAPNPGLLTPSAGYTFMWQGVSQGLGENVGTKSFLIPEKGVTRVEGEIAFDNKVVATDLGYMFNNVVA